MNHLHDKLTENSENAHHNFSGPKLMIVASINQPDINPQNSSFTDGYKNAKQKIVTSKQMEATMFHIFAEKKAQDNF